MKISKNPGFLFVFALFFLFLNAGAQTFSKYFVFGPNSQMSTSTFTNCHELSNQNGYLLTAEKYTSQNVRNTMLIRTDTALTETWSTMLNFRYAAPPFDNIYFSEVGELLNGNYFLFGYTGIVGRPTYVVFVLDTNGAVLNYRTLTDTLNSSNLSVIPSIHIATDSSLVITLSEYEKFGFYRLDQNLNLISSAVYSTHSNYSYGRGGLLLADTTLLFPGDSSGLVLTNTDLNGTILWSKFYPGIGNCFALCQTPSGSIYAGGFAHLPNGNAVSYIAKIGASGQLIWCHQYQMTNSWTMSAIWNLYPDGNKIAVYSDSIMFKIDSLGYPVGNGFTVNSDNYKVMKPCSGNEFMLAGPIYQSTPQTYRHTVMRFSMSSVSGCLQPRGVVLINSGSSPLVIHPTPLQHAIQSETILFSDTTVQMDYDFFYGCPVSFVGISENTGAAQTLAVFPNPASDELNVHYELNDPDAKLSFELTDVSGRIIKSEQVQISGENEFRVSLLNMAEGVYTITIYEDGTSAGHKLFVKH